jgi:hypothetical protein
MSAGITNLKRLDKQKQDAERIAAVRETVSALPTE